MTFVIYFMVVFFIDSFVVYDPLDLLEGHSYCLTLLGHIVLTHRPSLQHSTKQKYSQVFCSDI
jgi:hypothetical protein